MDQIEACAPASKTIKEEDEATENSTVGNIDDVRTAKKSVVSSVDVDLSDDVWLLVFRYLGTADRVHGRVARVCRRWRKLNEISWKSVTGLTFQHVFNTLRLGIPMAADAKAVRRHVLKASLQHSGTCLKRLDLDGEWSFSFNSHQQDLIIHHSASLQELNLSHSNFDNTQLKKIAQRIPRLRSINLCGCLQITEDGLKDAFTVGLQSLKSLDVTNIEITGEFFSLVPQSLIEVLVFTSIRLTNRGVRLLAEKCPNLETTDICRDFSFCSLQSIAYLYKKCSKLKRLKNLLGRLSRGWNLPTLQILYSLPLLEELHVTDDGNQHLVTDQFVGELSRHCPRINTISFFNCSELTNNALNHISTWIHLENITLIGSNQITDEGLIHFGSACPKLKIVDLSRCQQITHVGVCHFVSAHPNIRELDISDCRSVTQQLFPVVEFSFSHTRF